MANELNQSRLWKAGVYGFFGLLLLPSVTLAESTFLFFIVVTRRRSHRGLDSFL